MITELRGFFKCEVNVTTTTVNFENVDINFNKMVLYREDDDSTITIQDRRVVLEPVRTGDGFKVMIFILNEGEELEERIDWLIDEDYEIEEIDMSITNLLKNSPYEYSINYNIGEQIEKEVEIEVALPLKKAITYITSRMENNSLNNHIYEIMVENNDLIETINAIANIEVV